MRKETTKIVNQKSEVAFATKEQSFDEMVSDYEEKQRKLKVVIGILGIRLHGEDSHDYININDVKRYAEKKEDQSIFGQVFSASLAVALSTLVNILTTSPIKPSNIAISCLVCSSLFSIIFGFLSQKYKKRIGSLEDFIQKNKTSKKL
jgi:hypothetical protein